MFGTKQPEPIISEAKMDAMVQSASLPTLASLFKKAQASGLVEAQPAYR